MPRSPIESPLAPLPSGRLSRVRAFLYYLPGPIIALGLAMFALAIAHYFDWGRALVPFTLFVPGAIQRSNGRHLAAALLVGLLALLIQAAIRLADIDHFYVLSPILFPAVAMLLAGGLEWLLRGRPGIEKLAAVLAACLGAAALFAIAHSALA
ncbi:MAG TPA: hypothetical protein VHY20_15405, partial [Pirellulales bacterium]|nr:hypothetical protein [Pirellulales bacterium]